jgi:hypothetical protein
MARLAILTINEINALYTIPKLSDDERISLFELNEGDKAYLSTLDNTGKKVNYILQLGYYQAVNFFFLFTFQRVKEDVEFILEQYFPDQTFPKKRISKHSHYKNREQVCRKFELVEASDAFLQQLKKEAKQLAKRHVLPKFVLIEILSYCQQNKVIKPAYSTLQDIVSLTLKAEQNRLSSKLYNNADKSLRDQLDKLLQNDDLLYNLTLLKKDQKDFSTTEIKSTINKQQLIIALYQQSQNLIQSLDISEQNIIYYADLAEFYTIQKLRTSKSKNQTRLYLLCYIHRRLLKINDHLIASLVQKMLKYVRLGDEYQKKKVDTVEAVDKQLRNRAHKVMMINVDETISDDQVRKKAFQVVPKKDYNQFLDDFKKPNLDRDFYRWQQFGKLAHTIKMNIRPIFKVLSFSCDNDELRKAVDFLRKHIKGNKPFHVHEYQDIPLAFFPKSLKPLLLKSSPSDDPKEKEIDGNRYEFMVYWQLQKSIADITTYIKDSSGYRALEDDLIALEYWTTHKQEILDQLNMPLLSTNVVDLLDTLQSNIENQYLHVNQRIRSGENTSLKIRYNKKGELTHWTLPYKPLEDGINNPFFKKLPTQNIGDIARFVAQVTGYSKAFTHLQPKYSKVLADMETIHACIIANATGTEIKKMIDICDIKGSDMERTNKNFLRVQTLRQANDIIVNDIEKLPIFDEYNLSDYGVHASVDGQKFTTRYNTIKSRYAKKYFGLKKGVVLLTLSANTLPICLKVIGANEHESHYLLDLVESNTSDIEVKAVLGDMHSINRVNFALMHMFGYRFMPRFTRLADKSDNKLVCFGELADYDHHIIKPSKKAGNTKRMN